MYTFDVFDACSKILIEWFLSKFLKQRLRVIFSGSGSSPVPQWLQNYDLPSQ